MFVASPSVRAASQRLLQCSSCKWSLFTGGGYRRKLSGSTSARLRARPLLGVGVLYSAREWCRCVPLAASRAEREKTQPELSNTSVNLTLPLSRPQPRSTILSSCGHQDCPLCTACLSVAELLGERELTHRRVSCASSTAGRGSRRGRRGRDGRPARGRGGSLRHR